MLHSLFQGPDIVHLQLQLGSPVQIANHKENPGKNNFWAAGKLENITSCLWRGIGKELRLPDNLWCKTHSALQNFRSRRSDALGFSPSWLSTILAVDNALRLPVPAEQGDRARRAGVGYSSVPPTQLETSLLGDSQKTSQGPAKLEVRVEVQGDVRRNYASI